MQAVLLTVIVFFSMAMLFFNLYKYLFGGDLLIAKRLDNIKAQEHVNTNERMNQPLFRRTMKPILDGLGKALIKMAPHELVSSLEKKVIMAGRPFNRSLRDWVSIQAFTTFGLPLIFLLIIIQTGMTARVIFAYTLLIMAYGAVVPSMLLTGRIKRRQKKLMSELPDVIDLLTVSVEAGLSFDSALAKVIDKMPGVLAREFEEVLQEIKIGKSKKDALYKMVDRLELPDLRAFVSSVVQAEQLGVSIGRVLRIQSEQIRYNRKQRLQEKALKAPVKMLIPMVVFIFPTIFIVLLGPVILNLMKVFM